MIQKQYLHRQYQISYQEDQSRPSRTATFSPKIQFTNSQKKPTNNQLYQNSNNASKNPKSFAPHNNQPSESYEQYYQNRINITNSVSMGESLPSKNSRTQKSRDKLKALQSIKQEQEDIVKLKKKYSTLMKEEASRMSSNNMGQNFSKDRGNKLVSGMNPSMNSGSYGTNIVKSKSKTGRHMKTEFSKEKLSRQQTISNQQPSNTYNQPIESSNTNNNITYTRSINNSYSPRFYQNDESQKSKQKLMTSSQEYYTLSNRYNTSSNQNENSREPQRFESRNPHAQSRDASTVNTQQRTSSLSLNKFAKKPMLTFYHCQIKKFYKYNDEGYLTDRQIALRQKIQKAAEEALDRIIIQQEEQTENSKLHKSKSVGHFPKLNKLKEQADKEKKRKFELFGKYQLQAQKQENSKALKTISNSKQKSYNPSELPPSSSLSKRKFNVIYKEDDNDNILSKHQINDDSYHEREEKKNQSHAQQITQKARSSLIKRNKEKKSQIHPIQSQRDNGLSDYDMINSYNNQQINQQSPKGISKIGGITSQYMISSNQNVSNTVQQSKPSFVEQFSESSISGNDNHSNQNLKHNLSQNSSHKSSRSQNKGSLNRQSQSKSNSNLQKSQSQLSSNQSQNLQMINSNYKKVLLTEHGLKLNTSDNGSLKLKTNTDKNEQCKLLENDKVNVKPGRGSISSEEYFESEDQSVKKSSSYSVKSSHIGLTKENLAGKKSKQSKQSNYASQSVIQTNLKKKSSLKKWVRDSQNGSGLLNSSKANINMKKKQKVQISQSVPNLNSSKNSFEQNPRFSVESNCLKIDSTVNIQKNDARQRKSDSKIQQQSQSSKSDVRSKHKSVSVKSSVKQKSSSQHSQSSLLAESQHHIKPNSKIQNQTKKSRLNMQRQSHKSKIKSVSSRNSSLKIRIGNQASDKGQKYGNLLKVDKSHQSIASEQSQSQSQLKAISQNLPQFQKSKRSVNKSQTSEYISHHQTDEYSNGHDLGFNLIERAQQILQTEDDLHEKRRKLQNQEEMTEDFEDILAKIQAHISIIRQILQIATSAMDIYSEDSAWVFKSCLLSLKKYHLERVKVVDTLRGKKSCFKIAENQLAEQDLKQFLNDEEIKLLANDMEYCNGLNEKMIEDFVQFLRNYFGDDFSESEFNLRPFDDRFDLGILLEEYRTQILGLKQKAVPSQSHQPLKDSDSEVLEQETEEVIKKRIFRLMEVSFLLSELAGKRIKEFTEQIDIQDEFDEYYSDYWPYFQRIVKTFS